MDLLEYQGKELFSRHGLPVPEGSHAATPEEAHAASEELGYPVAVKAQVLIGGRGKAGGIKIAQDGAETHEHAASATHQPPALFKPNQQDIARGAGQDTRVRRGRLLLLARLHQGFCVGWGSHRLPRMGIQDRPQIAHIAHITRIQDVAPCPANPCNLCNLWTT